jgi:hypothetical protein
MLATYTTRAHREPFNAQRREMRHDSLVEDFMSPFDETIERLDTSLFHGIPTISSEGDRLSWLTVQRAVRRAKTEYAYLEIGSFVGGSLQQYYLDPKCRRIYSIDKRPDEQPDERGSGIIYDDNTCTVMMNNLARLDPNQLDKVRYFEADASAVNPREIVPRPDICFVDGEHTVEGVVRDYLFCSTICAEDAVIYFHDAPIVHTGLSEIVRRLRTHKTEFRAVKLKGSTFAILLPGSPAAADPDVLKLARSGEWFLTAMRAYQVVSKLVPPSPARWIRDWGKRIFG